MVKNEETQVPSLGHEDPLEKGVAFQYSCQKNSMDVGAWGATAHGVTKESDTTERLTLSLSRYLCIHSKAGVPNLQDLMPDDQKWN